MQRLAVSVFRMFRPQVQAQNGEDRKCTFATNASKQRKLGHRLTSSIIWIPGFSICLWMLAFGIQNFFTIPSIPGGCVFRLAYAIRRATLKERLTI